MHSIRLKSTSNRILFVSWSWQPLIILALALGALHTWAAISSHSMNADGISYLDIGDAYFSGDWENAINPVWSPLYSWVVGLVLFIFRPSMSWEFPLVHIVNFLIYLVALASFSYFWHQVKLYLQVRREGERNRLVFPEWALNSFGILLFTWVSLTLIEIWSVTPDMLMAALVYIAAALVLRMRSSALDWQSHALFGLVLGLGYLTKTIMLPTGLLFLLISLFSQANIRKGAPRVLLSLAMFILVSAPFIAAISWKAGHFTFGESGSVTYMRYVNGISYPHWQGEPPGYGSPIHPSRKILAEPPIYEFATPIGGTYPIAFNPYYWYEGIQLRYGLSETIRAFYSNSFFYFDLFMRQLGPVSGVVLLLYLVARRKPFKFPDIIRSWSLAFSAIPVFGLYSLVYVEGRYIAVFIVLIFADLLANLTLPQGEAYQKLITPASLVMIIFLLGSLFVYNAEGYARLSSQPADRALVTPAPGWPGEVAEELHSLGITQGERVGVIGYAFDSYWARLARVKIVAEMFEWEADPFYLGDSVFQARVVRDFTNAGASAIVAEYVPTYASLPGWHQVGETNYHIYLIGDP
jgi:hypothetical protein